MQHSPKKLLIALCLIPFLAASLSAGAKLPIDLSETVWQFEAKFAADVKKIDKIKVQDLADLTFGPSAAPLLAANEFLFTDPEGDSLTGTYLADAKQTTLTPDPASLDAYLTAKIQAAAVTAGVTIIINSIDVTSTTATAKPKSTKTGLALQVTLKIKAAADLLVDNVPFIAKLTVSLKGKDELILTVAGTQWEIPARIVSKLIDTDDDDILELYFGPNIDEGLAANEYKVINLAQDEYTGTYTVDDKANVTFTPNQAQFEQLITDLIEANLEGGGAIVHSLDITKITATAKIKHALSVTLKISIDYFGTVEFFGDTGSGSGKLTISGTGTPMND